MMNRNARFLLGLTACFLALGFPAMGAAGEVCPREGTWRVTDHPGVFACTGTKKWSQQLKLESRLGTIKVQDQCKILQTKAKSGSGDDMDLNLRRKDGNVFQGGMTTLYQGIPMVMDFTWTIVSPKKITGKIESRFHSQGLTCKMRRSSTLEYQHD